MLLVWFLSIKSLPNLLFRVLCLPGDQSHPFAQPTINPLACCICWAGLLGLAVFPPWNEGLNFGSYKTHFKLLPKSIPWLTDILLYYSFLLHTYTMILCHIMFMCVHLCICSVGCCERSVLSFFFFLPTQTGKGGLLRAGASVFC